MEKTTNRIVGFDLVRLVACFFVLLVHFNATVSGYDNGVLTYPNSILPGFFVENRVYLGTVGVLLFFLLSGASLTMTHRPGESVVNFYTRRALNIYPSFWIAFLVSTILDFFCYHGICSASPWNLAISFAGLDGYLSVLNLIPWEYYKVGEWFLGCLVLIYLVFPLIHPLVSKFPTSTAILTAVLYAMSLLCIRYQVPGLRTNESIMMYLAVVMLGMLYYRFSLQKHSLIVLIASCITLILAIVFRAYVRMELLNLVVACFIFALMMVIGEQIKSPAAGKLLQTLSSYTYPVFLVHTWLIRKLIQGFDLSTMPRMYVVILFGVYLVVTGFSAFYLAKAGSALAGKLRSNRVIMNLILVLLAFSIAFSCFSVVKYNIGKPDQVSKSDNLICLIEKAEVRDGTIVVTVSNTGSAEWSSEEEIRCGLFIDGVDSGIRSVLEPGQVISRNETVTFTFSMQDIPEEGVLAVSMLKEGIKYFGNPFTIHR